MSGQDPMTSPRRLSLRARMLIVVRGGRAVFRLMLGLVTTAVLTKRHSSQFNNDLVAAAARGPKALADNTGGYLAEAVSPRTGQIGVLTPGGHANGLSDVLSQMSLAEYRNWIGHGPTTIPLRGGQKVRALARVIFADQLAHAGVSLPAGRYRLVVAHATDTVTSQVSGIIIVELITGGALLALPAIGGSWRIGPGPGPPGQEATPAHQTTSRAAPPPPPAHAPAPPPPA